MTQVTVNLSDDLLQFVSGQVATGGYGDAGNYIAKLITHAKQESEQLESMLMEGLDSGEPIPLTSLEWAKIRGEVAARLSQ